MRKFYFVLFIAVLLASCLNKPTDDFTVTGYAPIYSNNNSDSTIYFSSTPSHITNGGKIVVVGNRMYVVESGRGIHVIQMSQDTIPQHLGFINIPACNDLAIKANYLYANNLRDLVILNISNLYEIKVENRILNSFQDNYMTAPPYSGAYFECVDTSKGTVIGWEEKELTNPKCYTN